MKYTVETSEGTFEVAADSPREAVELLIDLYEVISDTTTILSIKESK